MGSASIPRIKFESPANIYQRREELHRITVDAFPVPKDKWLYAHTYSAKISFITEKGAHIHTADWEQFLACAISQTIPG